MLYQFALTSSLTLADTNGTLKALISAERALTAWLIPKLSLQLGTMFPLSIPFKIFDVEYLSITPGGNNGFAIPMSQTLTPVMNKPLVPLWNSYVDHDNSLYAQSCFATTFGSAYNGLGGTAVAGSWTSGQPHAYSITVIVRGQFILNPVLQGLRPWKNRNIAGSNITLTPTDTEWSSVTTFSSSNNGQTRYNFTLGDAWTYTDGTRDIGVLNLPPYQLGRAPLAPLTGIIVDTSQVAIPGVSLSLGMAIDCIPRPDNNSVTTWSPPMGGAAVSIVGTPTVSLANGGVVGVTGVAGSPLEVKTSASSPLIVTSSTPPSPAVGRIAF